jgi:hypothetical protein
MPTAAEVAAPTAPRDLPGTERARQLKEFARTNPPPTAKYDSGPLAGGAIAGMTQLGNIDVNHRPQIRNADGKISSIFSMTVPVGADGKSLPWGAKNITGYALVPSIANGKFLTPDGKKPDAKNQRAMQALEDKATEHYDKTRQHLGIFKTEDAANRYADATHAYVNDGTTRTVYAPSGGR